MPLDPHRFCVLSLFGGVNRPGLSFMERAVWANRSNDGEPPAPPSPPATFDLIETPLRRTTRTLRLGDAGRQPLAMSLRQERKILWIEMYSGKLTPPILDSLRRVGKGAGVRLSGAEIRCSGKKFAQRAKKFAQTTG